jgi:predicted nucleic acid-binding protein
MGRRDPRRLGGAALLVDTGPLYAYVDREDPAHAACVRLLREHPGPLVAPTLCITEATYLLRARLGTEMEIRFLGDLARGAITLEPVHPADLLRIAELVSAYRDLPLGSVNASVVAAAERLGVTQLATLDRRDFSVVRPRHLDAFELLP